MGEGQRRLRGTWLRCPLTIAPVERVRVEESDNEYWVVNAGAKPIEAGGNAIVKTTSEVELIGIDEAR